MTTHVHEGEWCAACVAHGAAVMWPLPMTPIGLAQALDDHLPRMAFQQYGQHYNDDPDFDVEAYYLRVATEVLAAHPQAGPETLREADEFKEATDAAMNFGDGYAEARREMGALLVEHYVTAIDCDHDANTDTVRCNCSVWTGTPQPSIGAAVRQWVDHVLASPTTPEPGA